MEISLSRSCSDKASHHKKFKAVKVAGLEEVMRYSLAGAWSPIVWKGGDRANKNYDECSLLVLDFDSGDPSILEVIHKIRATNLQYFITTTKSHQIKKGRMQACDRFRMVFNLNSAVKDIESYYYLTSEAIKKFKGCDKACKDAARFFFPGKALASFRWEGKFLNIPTINKKKNIIHSENIINAAYVAEDCLPPLMEHDLINGYEEGTRNKSTFSLVCWMCKLGYSREKIKRLIFSSNISLETEEKKRIINNAIDFITNG